MNENIRLDDSTVFNPQTGEFGSLPEILVFETDKSMFSDESPATISWAVSNANVVRLNNEIVGTTGSQEFYATELLTIELEASNDLGSSAPRIITIDIDRTPPIILFFKASEEFAIKGSAITLFWEVFGAKTINIDNNIGYVTHHTSKTITIGDQGIYTLTARNYFGFLSTAEAYITLFPTPLIKNLFIPSPEFRIETITANQPTFSLDVCINGQMPFEGLNFVQLDHAASKLLYENPNVGNEISRPSIFQILSLKQKEISYIIKSIWRKEGKIKFKKILHRI